MVAYPARKVMLLGDIGVGKTSLARRFVFKTFEQSYKTTIGVDLLTHDVSLGDAADNGLRLVLWDTDGEYGQSLFDTAYARGASAAIVVGDLTRPATLYKQRGLLTTFSARNPGRPCLAVLNKSDLASPGEAVEALGVHADLVKVTSALTGDGVDDAFVTLAMTILRRSL